jgi:Ca2+-binding RTX toxin-like protein
MSDVIDIAGTGWFLTSNVTRHFKQNNLPITLQEARAYVTNYSTYLSNLSDDEISTLFELRDAITSGSLSILEVDKVVWEELLSAPQDRGSYNIVRNHFLANNIVYGTNMNDMIYGDDDTDNIIFAGTGNDIIVGFKGNDTLVGGSGSDKYVYYGGDGNDTIVDSEILGEQNILVFGEDIYPTDITFLSNDDDLHVIYNSTEHGNSIITIQNWFLEDTNTYHLAYIRFLADGTILTDAQINELANSISNTFGFIGGNFD